MRCAVGLWRWRLVHAGRLWLRKACVRTDALRLLNGLLSVLLGVLQLSQLLLLEMQQSRVRTLDLLQLLLDLLSKLLLLQILQVLKSIDWQARRRLVLNRRAVVI